MSHDIAGLLVVFGASVKDAMRQLDKNSRRIIFVTDNEQRLLGSVSDGDIRRWILKNGSLNASVKEIMNSAPFYFRNDYDCDVAKKIMLEKDIEWIPVINDDSKVTRVIFWDEIFGNTKAERAPAKNIPVVIMTGGKGTRLDPFTRILPKALIPLGEKAMIETIMDSFAEYGYKNFLLIVNYKGEMIKSYLDNIETDYSIRYFWEKHPLGTAGGLKLITDAVTDNFIVSNCDILVNTSYEEIFHFHLNNGNDITMVGSLQYHKVPYGVLRINEDGSLKEISEKPEFNFLVNTGLYILNRKVLSLLNPNMPIDFNDLICKAIESKAKVGVFPVTEGVWIDIGQLSEYQKMIKDIV